MYAFKLVAAGVGRFGDRAVDACVVVRRIETSVGGDSQIDHRFDLRLVGNVAVDGERLMPRSDKPGCCRFNRAFVDIREYDASAFGGKCPCCGKS
ncbi:hypothetical protein PTKU15_15630 [Paraburkholderia terrae]|nr:hypothetical protein PTKU15_15630 [Paraburkholderia terrae]